MKLQLAELTLEKKDGSEATVMQRLKVSWMDLASKMGLLIIVGSSISFA